MMGDVWYDSTGWSGDAEAKRLGKALERLSGEVWKAEQDASREVSVGAVGEPRIARQATEELSVVRRRRRSWRRIRRGK